MRKLPAATAGGRAVPFSTTPGGGDEL